MAAFSDITTQIDTTFDQLVSTSAERDALARLRQATVTVNGPMERHCLRCRQIARELGSRRQWVMDGELLTVAALLHDIGLYPAASRNGVYTSDGAALAREMLAEHGWSGERIERCADAIDRHHELRSQVARGPEVEALRLADLIDVSGNLLRFGLDKEWLRTLRREIPPDGLLHELRREVGRAVRERPTTLPRIFLRP